MVVQAIGRTQTNLFLYHRNLSDGFLFLVVIHQFECVWMWVWAKRTQLVHDRVIVTIFFSMVVVAAAEVVKRQHSKHQTVSHHHHHHHHLVSLRYNICSQIVISLSITYCWLRACISHVPGKSERVRDKDFFFWLLYFTHLCLDRGKMSRTLAEWIRLDGP